LFDLLFFAREQFTRLPMFRAQDPVLMQRGFFSLSEGVLQGFYQGITDRPVCIDKSRGWVGDFEFLQSFHPNPKVLVCVRDLRSILSSMEKLWRKNSQYHPEGEDATGMRMATVQQRVVHWLSNVPLGNNILRLMGALERDHLRHFHIVKFEELTSNPAQVLKNIYNYLEEEPFEHDFENLKQLTQEDDSYHGTFGDHRIRQKVAPVSPDYHAILGKELSETVRRDNALFYDTFYRAR
jgi:sulfotransferase